MLCRKFELILYQNRINFDITTCAKFYFLEDSMKNRILLCSLSLFSFPLSLSLSLLPSLSLPLPPSLSLPLPPSLLLSLPSLPLPSLPPSLPPSLSQDGVVCLVYCILWGVAVLTCITWISDAGIRIIVSQLIK